MSNIHGLSSKKKNDDDDDDEANNQYVGGVDGRGGGSGLAVQPNNDDASGARDNVFRLAEGASANEATAAGDGNNEVRRSITMYRNGFVVDDGPYRRLDDPANAEFLNSLAQGKTPRELVQGAGSNDITVGLIDKRSEEYVEKFQSFSGAGSSLRNAAVSDSGSVDGAIDPASLPAQPPAADTNQPTTSIAVRLLNGKRKVIKINLSSSVLVLASHLREASPSTSFRLLSGFPPKPLIDMKMSIEDAGLKGAQVSMSKV